MKHMAAMIVMLALACLGPALLAQEEHGEVGVFADLTRLHNFGDTNFVGAGGQVAFNLNNFVQLEGTMAYDWGRNVTSTTSNGISTSFSRSRLRLLNGLFGPKIQTGIGPVKAFIVLKGGFLNFSFSRAPVTAGNFATTVSNVPSGDTNGVFYPGGGLEFFIGHVFGIRMEAGDEMYFDNGAHNNLRIGFGPQFRF